MTLSQVAEALGITKNGAKYHLGKLHPDGLPTDAEGVVIVSEEDFAAIKAKCPPRTSHAAITKKAENKPLKASETVAKELSEAKQNATESAEKAAKLTEELVAVKAELAEKTEALAKQEQEAIQANARTVEALQEVAVLKGELEQLRPLHQTVEDLRKERDTAKAELSGAESDRDAMTDAYNRSQEEAERLRTRCTELKADVERLEGIREALVHECLAATTECRKMAASFAESQAKLTSQAQQLAGLALQKQGFGARLKALFAPRKAEPVTVEADDE